MHGLFLDLSRLRQSDLVYRMAGPILHSEDRIPWASRPTSPVPLRSSAGSDTEGNVLIPPPTSIVQGYQDPLYVLPPEEHRVVDQSPNSISQSQEGEPYGKPQVSSAPAEIYNPHHRLSQLTQKTDAGLTRAFKSLSLELNPDGPYHARRDQGNSQAAHPTIPTPSSESEDTLKHARDAALQTVAEEPTKDLDAPKEGSAEARGRPFRVDWICTEPLSFSRTKHLRNPWNHGREVKISRDGTELEPSIGRQLLEEWDRRSPSPADVPAVSSEPHTALRRHGSKST